MKRYSILNLELHFEHDVVLARQRARQIAALFGFDQRDQTRIATATSEIARNAFKYAGGGRVSFELDQGSPPVYRITIRDQGAGIEGLSEILAGRYSSPTGLGLGIIGARRLVDQFHIESSEEQGTTVVLQKNIAHALLPEELGRISAELASHSPENPLEEMQQQNRELIRTLEELRLRQAELARVNRELEDTNRGVVALYAELDDRADYQQRASELKSLFLANMSHEFRTPLNVILSLSRLLTDRTDGDLTSEQAKQVGFITKAAGDLSELVNDLLDLAKVEAGKVVVRPASFEVANLFSALRGMLRPLLVQKSLDLVLEAPEGLPAIYSDEAKLSQILRNFISNALKYTEKGDVRVTARLADNQQVVFAVQDTGIGIAPQDRERIFEEWVQVDNALQKQVKGTGLGLPLSRKLAEMLGGSVWVESELGKGSTFYVSIPLAYAGAEQVSVTPERKRELDPNRVPVLVVEDNRETLLVYEKYLRHSAYQLISVQTLREARRALEELRPAAILLDVLLEGENTWMWLNELKAGASTKTIPVIVATVVDDSGKASCLGADAFVVKPIERHWLLGTLSQLTGTRISDKVLIVDDDPAFRYVLRTQLQRAGCEVIEADSGPAGLQRAREEAPQAIVLDLNMEGLSGLEVLEQLKSDPATTQILVLVYTAKRLTAAERQKLAPWTAAILSKDAPPESLTQALQNAGVVLTAEREASHA